MTILIFFQIQLKKRIGFYKLSFYFFRFNLLPAFPPRFPAFPPLIPGISTLILIILTPIPCIFFLDSPHSHPDSPHSHPDSPHFHPDSPNSHPDSPHSHHSLHSVPRFPILAFTHSQIICWRFHIKTHFTFWDMPTYDMWKICLQTFRNNSIC